MSLYSMPSVASMISTPAVVAAVGQRIYALRAPQDVEPPYITWMPIVAEEMPDLDLPQHDLARARVQVDVWARSYLEAIQIAGDVREAMADHGVVMMARAVADPDTDLARVIIEGEIVMH